MEVLENMKYLRAKERVDRIRGFYSHLLTYLIVNISISTYKIIRNLKNGETFEDAFFDFSTYLVWIAWGIGLVLHVFAVFGPGKHWEEKKIKQFMEEEQNNLNY